MQPSEMHDILRICDEIDKAAGKATPRPWEWEAADSSHCALGTAGKVYLDGWVLGCSRCKACQSQDEKRFRCDQPSAANADYIAHAANYAPTLTKLVRLLAEYVQLAERLRIARLSGVRWQLIKRLDEIRAELRRDYPGLLDAKEAECEKPSAS